MVSPASDDAFLDMTEDRLPHIIAVNGPPASGKTMISSMLSERLGYRRIYTGLCFYMLGDKVYQNGIEARYQAEKARKMAAELTRHTDVADALLHNSTDGLSYATSGTVFGEAAKSRASIIAADPTVRDWARQQIFQALAALPETARIVLDRGGYGEQAVINLIAELEIRVRRRYHQNIGRGDAAITHDQVRQYLTARLTADQPGRFENGAIPAITIDTTSITPEQVYDKCARFLRAL